MASNEHIMDKISKNKPKLLCINDGECVNDKNREYVKVLLERFFPNKSEFEKA